MNVTVLLSFSFHNTKIYEKKQNTEFENRNIFFSLVVRKKWNINLHIKDRADLRLHFGIYPVLFDLVIGAGCWEAFSECECAHLIFIWKLEFYVLSRSTERIDSSFLRLLQLIKIVRHAAERTHENLVSQCGDWGSKLNLF